MSSASWFAGRDPHIGTKSLSIDPNTEILLLSGCLEKFVSWTGSGGNGKSKLLEMFLKAMGDYAKNLPVSLLTQKRNHSSAASPEVAQTVACRAVFFQEPDENSN